MARIERKHEVVAGALTDELLRTKAEQGWRPVGVVWERTLEGEAADETLEPVPYGLRVSGDCSTLEPDAGEIDAMIRMLRGIVEEKAFSDIADDLNAGGHRTRRGGEWNQTSIFHMLPRLIEVAPTIYSSEAWHALRKHLSPHG